MMKLNEMSKKDLQALALEKGFKLSYKAEDGKRQRYTMAQLVEMIESTLEVKPASKIDLRKKIDLSKKPLTKKVDITKYIKVNVEKAEKVVIPAPKKVYSLKNVIIELSKINDLQQLKEYKQQILNYFAGVGNVKKKSIKKHLAVELNKINYVLKMKELKIQ